MKYSFDTSSFIELNHQYPQDIFPSAWEWVSNHIESGDIVATIYVYDEVKPIQDEIYEFLKERSGKVFQSSDFEQDEIVKDIVNNLFEGWVKESSTDNNADPFVIALAKKFNLTVVSEEKLNPDKISIPVVCIRLGVEHCNLLDFMRETGFKV
jgi:hypothetical protein